MEDFEFEHVEKNEPAEDSLKSERTTNRGSDIYSNVVRAGKRTYFFDVKSTQRGEYYLTITESKKRFNRDTGHAIFEKHIIFLYKEDFKKFTEGLNETVRYIDVNNAEFKPFGHQDETLAEEKQDEQVV
ncbi:MAG: DUF3276 family protein [Bacteroidia bacterium]|nr:DUF3276 family protein [Bacteroidia bacterium]